MALFLPITIIVLCISLYEAGDAVQRRTIDGIKYYIDYSRGYKWHEAMRICSYHQMYLIDIRTSLEDDRIATFVNETRLKLNEKEALRYWTSGSDLACNRTWTWLTTGERVVYSNWHIGEPNNSNGYQRCIVTEWRKEQPSVIKWNDFYCNHTAYIICRYTVDVPLIFNVKWETIKKN